MSLGFKRTQTNRFVKLGKRQKSKQKWRVPKGIHNKMRERRKNKPKVVEIGYRTPSEDRGKINNKRIVLVKNLKEAGKANKNNILIIGKMGKKKRQEVLNKLKDFEVLNRK